MDAEGQTKKTLFTIVVLCFVFFESIGTGDLSRDAFGSNNPASDRNSQKASQNNPTARQVYLFQSGSGRGTYHNVAMAIASLAAKVSPSDSLVVTTSLGSIANIDSLYAGAADFAIVQSNDLNYLVRQHREYPLFRKRIKAIASLFTEPIHIVCRRNLHITGIMDLSGREVNLGPKGSGTHNNALGILAAAGLLDKIKVNEMGTRDAISALRSGKVDVAFFTVSPFVQGPVRELLIESDDFDILGLGSRVLKQLHAEVPYLEQVYIPREAYRFLERPVLTVGVSAVLVCRSDVSASLVENLTRELFENRDRYPPGIKEQIDVRRATRHLAIDVHEGARAYYESIRLYTGFFAVLEWVVFLVCIGALAYLISRTYGPKARKKAYSKLTRLLYLLLFLWTTGAFVMFRMEHSVNENFGSLTESFWSIATYLLSGFEDKYPITPVGRVVSFVVLALGIGLVAYITAEIASMLTHHRIREEADMKRFKDHIVVCNWGARGEKVIREIVSPISPLRGVDVGILSNKEHKFASIPDKALQNVERIDGDPRSVECLLKAGSHRARAVVVLADDALSDPDGNSAQVLLALRELFDRERVEENRPRLLVEVEDPRNREVLKHAGADILVCGEDFAIGTLAQSAVFPGMTKIYEEFLDYTGDTNEFYVKRVAELPEQFKNECVLGKHFRDVAYRVMDLSEPEHPVILTGIKKGSQVILNPRREEPVEARRFEHFAEDDSLIFIAYEDPDVHKIFSADRIKTTLHRQLEAHTFPTESESARDEFSGDGQSSDAQILICNWGPTGEKIVEELHDKSSPARRTQIVVLSDEIVDDRRYVKNTSFKEHVVFLTGRASNTNVLRKLGAHRSISVIVLSNKDMEDPDGESTLTLLALKTLFDQELSDSDVKPNVIVEAVNHRNREVMIGGGAKEIVSKDDFTMGILAQSCSYPQISGIYQELLDYDVDNNEMYISAWEELTQGMQEELLGSDFTEIQRYFMERRSAGNPMLPVGIDRDGEFIINPRGSKTGAGGGFDRFREGDALIFISYGHPDFKSALVEV